MVKGAEELEFRDVEAFDANRCIAMSVGESEASRIYRTSDGGGTWKLAFQDSIHGFAVGGDYTKEAEGERNAFSTSDGGKSWTMLKGADGLSVFSFRSCIREVRDSKRIIAVGPDACNLSRDGGKTWTSSANTASKTACPKSDPTSFYASSTNASSENAVSQQGKDPQHLRNK